MPIKIITDDTPIVAGMVICAARERSDHCTGPRTITKVAGQRLHFDKESGPSFMLRKQATYLCDTMEEGEAWFQLLYARADEISKQESIAKSAARKAVLEKFKPQLDEMLG